MNPTNYDRWPIHLVSDAYARLCVSEPASITEIKQTFDGRSRFLDSLVVGTGSATYSSANRNTALTVAASGDRAILQTHNYQNYQVGKAQQVLAGFAFNAHTAGLVQRVGFFDDDNGAFLQLDDSGWSVNYRSGGSTTLSIPRAQWMDPLDGTGASKITLNPTARQVMCCSFSGSMWQSCRMGLLHQGRWVPLYCGGFSNSLTAGPLTPNLPVRWEITTTGGAGTLLAGSCAVQSEGGRELLGAHRQAWTDAAKTVGAGVTTMLVSVRNKSGQYLRAPTKVAEASVLCSTTGAAQWALVLNPTLAGTASWVQPANSYAEYDVSRTTMTAGTGTVLHTGFFSDDANHAEANIREAIQLGADIAGTTRDEVALVVKNLSTSGNDFYGSIGWTEQN